MAPKNNDSTTTTSSVPVPIKNALNLDVEHAPFTHPELRGEFPTKTYDPIPVLPYEDRALKADPTFKNLLANATVTHLEPKIGTEISGLQLHELTDAQKDELALLIAHRGVVFFRDQKLSIEEQLDLGRYYGPLHVHQTVAHAKGIPQVHVVENTLEGSQKRLNSQALEPVNLWHSDVSYERQPPSYTSFKVVTTGGFRTVGVGNAKADQIETGFSLSHSFIAISTLGRFEDEKGGNDQRLAISNLTLYC